MRYNFQRYRQVLENPDLFACNFDEIKMKYFHSNGELAFPQNLLDAAHKIMEDELNADKRSKEYDICFAFFMQQVLYFCRSFLFRFTLNLLNKFYKILC